MRILCKTEKKHGAVYRKRNSININVISGIRSNKEEHLMEWKERKIKISNNNKSKKKKESTNNQKESSKHRFLQTLNLFYIQEKKKHERLLKYNQTKNEKESREPKKKVLKKSEREIENHI